MDNDFVDVFPSAGGVGDSPVKTTASEGHLNQGSSSRPGLSLSIPDTGGREALVSPAIPGSRGVSVASMAKESALRSARPVSGASTPAAREEDVVMSLDTPSESPAAVGGGGLMMPLTIDPGGECMPTELEKKRAKLEKYKYECSEVADSFLYVSGEDAAKQQGLVGSKGITHIINCAGPQCPNYLEYTGRFNFLRLNFYDHRTEDCAWFMYKAFDFIKAAEQQRGRVLVHCVQGVSRSCTLAIAWLMLTEGVDYDEAYLRVRHGRPICAPNTGFICSLLEWQRRRQQPPSSPLLYRTAWHVPLFPNDLVLKICLHEDDRQHVLPTLAALDSRGCYLLVVPRRRREKNNAGGRPSRTQGIGAGSSSRTSGATFSTNPSRTSNFALPVVPGGIQTPVANGNGKRSNVAGGSGGSGSGGSDSPAPPVSRAALGRLSTPSPAAARAKAAAAAAVIANAKAVAAVAAAKEAQAVAAAAAAEEAVMVAKAVEAGVAVPWTWRESEVTSRGAPKARLSAGASPPQAAGAARHMVVSDSPAAAVRPSSAPGPRLRPIGVGAGDVEEEEEEEEGGVDVYVWRGTQSNERMLELAKEGAGWLHDYEGWGVGSSAPVVEEGQETPQVLRHLQSTGDNPREPPVYGDLSSPSPPPTAARTGSSAFMPCPTPSHHGGGGMGRSAPMLSPAETPTLSPAGPSPSPGGVSFSPYGCGVSPAGSTLFGSGQGGAGATISPSGSTAVSPAPSHHKLSIGSGYGAAMGSGYGSGYNPPRCSMASATEEMDEDEEEEEEEDEHEERVAMGLSPLGEARPAALGVPESGGGGRGGGDIPKLYELADELGGQGTSGLRWSHLAIFDDQDLLPQCCFLLVTPGKQSFLWVGEAFAAGLVQAVSTLQQLQALAKDVAVRDARRKSDRQLPRPSDVETALLVLGDGSEPPEWWSAFESGYT